MSGGWNAKTPPGVARCGCVPRREAWARLNWEVAGRACCGRSCCRAPVSLVVCTREELAQLRARCRADGWACPRCGAPVLAHQRGFACVDPLARLTQYRRSHRQGGTP